MFRKQVLGFISRHEFTAVEKARSDTDIVGGRVQKRKVNIPIDIDNHHVPEGFGHFFFVDNPDQRSSTAGKKQDAGKKIIESLHK
jgi:hypothetical protein